MIASWQISRAFLQGMKELNDAGIINAAAALGTLLAVVVALLPSISRWWKHPKLTLEIPPNHYRVSTSTPVEGIAYMETATVLGVGGPILGPPKKLFCSAALLVRNTGISAAVATRVVATDMYGLGSDGSATAREFSQRQIVGVEELPGGLTAHFVIVNRVQIDSYDSRFVIGRPLTATVKTINITRTVDVAPSESDIQTGGLHVLRLVLSASNGRAKSHLVMVCIGADDSIKLSLPTRAVAQKIRLADRRRTQPQVSAGG